MIHNGRKRLGLLLVLLMLFLMGTCFTTGEKKTLAAKPSKEAGITLDCARRYYSVSQIKRIIRGIARYPKGYLQLHFTDNQNVGIECTLLGQTKERARSNQDGSWTNPDTGKKFLTKEQIQALIAYGKKYQVILIPEIDLPGHAGGFLKLLEMQEGKAAREEVEADRERFPGELNLTRSKTYELARGLFEEYGNLFTGCPYFHMGCDEYQAAHGQKVIDWINDMSDLLEKRGYQVRIWNDLMRKNNLEQINHRIQITYWSYDGDVQDERIKKARRRVRASMPELIEEGFQVINENSYYLYYVPSKKQCTKSNFQYGKNDLQENWNLKVWDQDTGQCLKNEQGVIGAALGIWGEDSKGVATSVIQKQGLALFQIMADKMIGENP